MPVSIPLIAFIAAITFQPTAEASVSAPIAANLYEAAEIREIYLGTLKPMPTAIRKQFASRGSFSQEKLNAVSVATEATFRQDVFEPIVLASLSSTLDSDTATKTLTFLKSNAGRLVVAADVATANSDPSEVENVMRGEREVSSTPARDSIFVEIERLTGAAEVSTLSYMAMNQAISDGIATAGGVNPPEEDGRARSQREIQTKEMESRMRDPARRYVAFAYRSLNDDDLRSFVTFLQSNAGGRWVQSANRASQAAYEGMGKRCGVEIGNRWRALK